MELHAFAYLVDIVIVTPTFDEHLEWLKRVLSKISTANLTINPEKCEFCHSQIRIYLAKERPNCRSRKSKTDLRISGSEQSQAALSIFWHIVMIPSFYPVIRYPQRITYAVLKEK